MSRGKSDLQKNGRKWKMNIEVISGCEGYCLGVNNRRVCGNKPWGGGSVIAKWKVPDKKFIEELELAGVKLQQHQGMKPKTMKMLVDIAKQEMVYGTDGFSETYNQIRHNAKVAFVRQVLDSENVKWGVGE